ncbi:MAG: hypothetical protein JNK82_36735 [Myxococcaceae bacterium]|nr:hypothetical protein [Myxococcaceae bacterium]
MDYTLLIYASESKFGEMTPEQQGAIFEGHNVFSKELIGTGRGRSGAALEPAATSTCLRVRDGKALLTDGPFAETKEQLGGFYTFSTNNVDELVSMASKIPDAAYGSIEVRPLPDMPGRPPYPPVAAKPADAKKEYLLLIYEDEKRWTKLSEAEKGKIFGRYFQLSSELRQTGLWVDGAALATSDTAKTVKLRDGKRLVTDGPFAETKEQLGGFYQVWARDLDHAVSLAKKIPAAETGTIEVRPVMDVSQFMKP